MTIKEVLQIANDDKLMFMLNEIAESIKNDIGSTEYELKAEEKRRKEYAKRLIAELKAN